MERKDTLLAKCLLTGNPFTGTDYHVDFCTTAVVHKYIEVILNMSKQNDGSARLTIATMYTHQNNT